MVIRVHEICGAADTASQGETLYRNLLDALQCDSQVVVSFVNVHTATSSFVNTSFVQLLRQLSLEEIKRRIKIVESTRQINDMIRRRLIREAELAA